MTRRIETTLGVPLVQHGSVWALDLEGQLLLHGLSVLSRALGERVLSQARSDRIDITVEREVRVSENPELLQRFGVSMIQLCAEHRTVQGIVRAIPISSRTGCGRSSGRFSAPATGRSCFQNSADGLERTGLPTRLLAH